MEPLWERGSASDTTVIVPHEADSDVHSSNGDIAAHRVAETLTLRTSNGNITARLTGESPCVRVSPSTSNGNIRFERSVAVSALTGRNHLEGVIGNGAAVLVLRTSNATATIE